MRNLRRPNPIIACLAALLLAACAQSIAIEATNLSALSKSNDRSVVENSLGKPTDVLEKGGLTVAVYEFDKGYVGGYIPTGCQPFCYWPMIAFVIPVLLIDRAVQHDDAYDEQHSRLAAIFDTDNKLVFARFLDEPDLTSEKLASIATRFNEAQSGNEAALIDLSEITLISGQKQTFLETAANGGSAEAAFELGEAYNAGAGVEQSDANAVKWWSQAGRGDYAPVYKKLGKAYQTGTGVERDLEQARVWYAKAGENGDGEAMEIAADLAALLPYLNGATPADPEAKYRLARAHERGTVIPQNLPEAERLLRESAEEGYAPAQAGYGDKISATGDGPADALKWYRLAAAQGYAPAQTILGKRYLAGLGIERDREQAKVWLTRAAEAGDDSAIEALETMAQNEDRVNKLHATAQQGDAVSQRKLGHAYQTGEGVDYDMTEAVKWYEQAAASGDVDSQYALGWLHENGAEIEHDPITAFKWYAIANLGYPAAEIRKNSLKEKMTAAQIAEAERLAREWLKTHPQ